MNTKDYSPVRDGFTVSVLGVGGSGKSTFAKSAAKWTLEQGKKVFAFLAPPEIASYAGVDIEYVTLDDPEWHPSMESFKAHGYRNAIKALIDKYGVRFDPALRDQVMVRYKQLDIPTYWVGINPDLHAGFGPKGEVAKVEISYPRDYVKQQLAYSAMFASQP